MRTFRFHPIGLRALLLCLALAACGAPESATTTTRVPQPTPTIASVFGDPATHTPTTLASTATPARTSTPAPRAIPTRVVDGTIEVVSIYDEKLNPNWTLENTSGVKYELASTNAQRGKLSLQARPAKGLAKLYFSVREQSRDTYERKRVLGLRFWLSGGENPIATTDLGVAIIGSNAYPYWAADDTSVKINATVTADAPLFSETRLYDLYINRDLPPNSWVEVVVWLDSLQFDPEYAYVTGFYIKNDELFLDPYYLDHVDLLLEPKP